MNFTIQREMLLKPLQMVMGAVERRQTLPILSNLRLEVGDKFLLLTGTDLEIELNAKIPLTQVKKEGLVTIPARKFMDICRNFSENQSIELFLEENRVHIRSGRSKYVLNTLSVYEFPRLESDIQAASFMLPSAILRDLVDQTAFSMAQQDVRYYLNGLLLDFQASALRAVATDGHRLATMRVELDKTIEKPLQIIVPRKAVYELNKIFADYEGDLKVSIGTLCLQVQTEGYSFITKLIEGKFPDYQQVIPKDSGITAILDREIFKQLLNRASVLLTDKFRGGALKFSKNTLQIQVKNSEQDEAEEEMEIQYDGPSMRIGFNLSYLLDYINILHVERISMLLTDPNTSVLLSPAGVSDVLYVVMPMRL